jgi:hypothetical protein
MRWNERPGGDILLHRLACLAFLEREYGRDRYMCIIWEDLSAILAFAFAVLHWGRK